MLKPRITSPVCFASATFASVIFAMLLLQTMPSATAAQGDEMTDFKEGQVTANGLVFHYLELGEGPLVLALHGFPDHARSYRHQMPALAEAGFRVVVPYMRGYAPTEVPEGGPWAVPFLGQDAVALIDALSEGPAILIGHDWGAAAAYAAAAAAPEKISKLVTMAVPYGPGFMTSFVTNPEQQRRSWYMFFFQNAFAEAAVSHDDFAFLERLWREWSPGWSYPESEMVLLKETFKKPGVLSAALGYYRHTFNPPPEVAAQLAELGGGGSDSIQVPTLYLHGERDGCIGIELSEGMDTLFAAGLERRVIEGAGHFLHQEKPEEVNRALLEFLER